MKRIILMGAIIGLFISCSKSDETAPYYAPPAGVANITLTTDGGTEFKINGPCGWASGGGVHYIGANDQANNLKVFSADFNIDILPTVTTTYTLVGDSSDTDPTHITMYIDQINGTNFTEWDSYVGSGELTLVVNGNEITADLSGIQLNADETNLAPYNSDGTLSGTLKFYR